MMIYYQKKNTIVRDSAKEDLPYLAEHLRQADKDEVWAAVHMEPMEALLKSLDNSVRCYTVVRDDKPILIFGVAPVTLLGTTGAIWMLATDDLCQVSRQFIRESRKFIKSMLELYPHLYNMIDVRNEVSIRWLKWCGAKFGTTIPFGVDKLPFQYFEFRR